MGAEKRSCLVNYMDPDVVEGSSSRCVGNTEQNRHFADKRTGLDEHRYLCGSAQNFNATFGSGNTTFTFEDPDGAKLPAKLDHARSWFGQIDAIGHRDVVVPGTTTSIDLRAQDVDGPFGRPMLRLRSAQERP
mgnify:CR=1 FL=1